MASSSPPVTKVCYLTVRPMSVVAECQAIAYIQSSFILVDEKSGKQLLDLPYTSICAMEGDINNGELTIAYTAQSGYGPVEHWLQLQCEASDVWQRRCAIDFISTYMTYINPSPIIDHFPPTNETPRHSYAIEWPEIGIATSGDSDDVNGGVSGGVGGGGGAGCGREPSQPVVISPKDGGMVAPKARLETRQRLKRPDFRQPPIPMPTPPRRPATLARQHARPPAPAPPPRSTPTATAYVTASGTAVAAAVGKSGITLPPRSPAGRFPAGGGTTSPVVLPGVQKPPIPPKPGQQGRMPNSLPWCSKLTASAAHSKPGMVWPPTNRPELPLPASQSQDAAQSSSCNSEQPTSTLNNTGATPATVEAGGEPDERAPAYEPVHRNPKSNGLRAAGNTHTDAGRWAGNDKPLGRREAPYDCNPIRRGSVNQPYAVTNIPQQLGGNTGNVRQHRPMEPLPISNGTQQRRSGESLPPLYPAVLLHSSDPLPLPPSPLSPPGRRQTEREEGKEDRSNDYMDMGPILQQLPPDTAGRSGQADAQQTTTTDTNPPWKSTFGAMANPCLCTPNTVTNPPWKCAGRVMDSPFLRTPNTVTNPPRKCAGRVMDSPFLRTPNTVTNPPWKCAGRVMDSPFLCTPNTVTNPPWKSTFGAMAKPFLRSPTTDTHPPRKSAGIAMTNPLRRNMQLSSKHEPAVLSDKPPASQKDNPVASTPSEETDQPINDNVPLAASLTEGDGHGAVSSGSDAVLLPDSTQSLAAAGGSGQADAKQTTTTDTNSPREFAGRVMHSPFLRTPNTDTIPPGKSTFGAMANPFPCTPNTDINRFRMSASGAMAKSFLRSPTTDTTEGDGHGAVSSGSDAVLSPDSTQSLAATGRSRQADAQQTTTTDTNPPRKCAGRVMDSPFLRTPNTDTIPPGTFGAMANPFQCTPSADTHSPRKCAGVAMTNPPRRNMQPNSKHDPAVLSDKPPASQKDNPVASTPSEETDQPINDNVPLAASLTEGDGHGAVSSGSDAVLSPDSTQPLANGYMLESHDSDSVSSDDSDSKNYNSPPTPNQVNAKKQNQQRRPYR